MEGQIFCLLEEDKNASCETPFKYLTPSLSQMSSAKLIITLFSQALSEAGKESVERYHDLSSAGSAVRKKVPSLVPKSIEPILYFMINQIESEISFLDMDPVAGVIEWGFYRLNDVPKRWCDIVWTCRGSVDYDKMAEKVFVDDRVQHLKPFKQFLAYMYSLEDEIVDSSIDFEGQWFYMNDGAFLNPNVLSYWGESDERRVELLDNWLHQDGQNYLIHNRKEHYCSVLSKISEKMMKRLLVEFKETIFRLFFNNLLYTDYCLQILDLMKLYGIDFNNDVEGYAWWNRLCSNIIREPPKNILEYQQYISIYRIMYYQFLPSKKTTEIVCPYLQLISWEIDFEQVEYIISQLDYNSKKEILYYNRKDIALHLLKKNQVKFLIKFVDLCLSNENDRSMFKESLIQEQGKDIAFSHFMEEKVSQFIQFLKWTFGNESKIENFKKNIFDEVFWLFLNSVNSTHLGETPLRPYLQINSKKSLSAIESFLEWCLSSKEGVRKCKAFLAENLLRAYDDSSDSVRKEGTVDGEFKLWLFEYDEEKIKSIKFTNFYSKLYQLRRKDINLVSDFYHDFWSDS